MKKYWAGFCDDKIYVSHITEPTGDRIPIIAIYPRKKDAKQFFQDVRQVEINEIKAVAK